LEISAGALDAVSGLSGGVPAAGVCANVRDMATATKKKYAINFIGPEGWWAYPWGFGRAAGST
jgi:hypothetical protein